MRASDFVIHSSFAIRHSFVIRHSSFVIFLFACLGGGLATSQRVHGEPSSPATAAVTTNAPATRSLEAAELVTLLTDTLQREAVKTRGELELRLTRPWVARTIPDAPLTVKLLELPNAGVTPSCIVRFELWCGSPPPRTSTLTADRILSQVRNISVAPGAGVAAANLPCGESPPPAGPGRIRGEEPHLQSADQKLGEWQLPLQAHIWREAWVAHANLKRGDNLADIDIQRERRDVINLREPLAEFPQPDPAFELAEPIQNSAILLARSVRLKPVIHRGQLAEALLEDGPLRVTMKVEALEDGVPGQVIRARNPQTRRDLRGKVLNEQTIALSL